MPPKLSEAIWCALDISSRTRNSLLKNYIQSAPRYHLLDANSQTPITSSQAEDSGIVVNILTTNLKINFVNIEFLTSTEIDHLRRWFKFSTGFIITLNLDDYQHAQETILSDITKKYQKLLPYLKLYKADSKPKILVLTKTSPVPPAVWELALIEQLKIMFQANIPDPPFCDFNEVLLVGNSIPASLDHLIRYCQQVFLSVPLADDNIFGIIHLYLAEKQTTKDEGQLDYFCFLLRDLYAQQDSSTYPAIINRYYKIAQTKFKPGWFSGIHRFIEYLHRLKLNLQDLVNLQSQLNLYKLFISIEEFSISFNFGDHSIVTIAEIVPLKRIISARVFTSIVCASLPAPAAQAEAVAPISAAISFPELNVQATNPFRLYEDDAL